MTEASGDIHDSDDTLTVFVDLDTDASNPDHSKLHLSHLRDTGVGASELQSLHQQLAKALAKPSTRMQHFQSNLQDINRISHWSNDSDSTVAPDKGSSAEEDFEAELGLDLDFLDDAVSMHIRDEHTMHIRDDHTMSATKNSQLIGHVNQADAYNSNVVAPSTMMIRNLPAGYSQSKLVEDLENLGFGGTFDFLYLPVDSRTATSIGDAFVNFINPSFASQCTEAFQTGHEASCRLAYVPVALLQRLNANLQHYNKQGAA
jgi:hypothetical protein